MIPIQISSFKSDLEIPSLPTLVLLLSPLMPHSLLVQTHQFFPEAVLILIRHSRPFSAGFSWLRSNKEAVPLGCPEKNIENVWTLIWGIFWGSFLPLSSGSRDH